MKRCKCCGIDKPKSEFAKNKSKPDGLQYRCKSCAADYRAKNKERILVQKRGHYAENKERLLSEKKAKYLECADKKRTYQREYYLKDPEKRLRKSKEFHIKNPDYYKDFRKRNSDKVNAKEVRRKAAKINRTPNWLTKEDHVQIQREYELAAWCSKVMGVKYHVDHILPLQGKLVSGLHVPSNLQVIPWYENLEKHNKFEVI